LVPSSGLPVLGEIGEEGVVGPETPPRSLSSFFLQ
jgi:hypothetical protein